MIDLKPIDNPTDIEIFVREGLKEVSKGKPTLPKQRVIRLLTAIEQMNELKRLFKVGDKGLFVLLGFYRNWVVKKKGMTLRSLTLMVYGGNCSISSYSVVQMIKDDLVSRGLVEHYGRIGHNGILWGPTVKLISALSAYDEMLSVVA